MHKKYFLAALFLCFAFLPRAFSLQSDNLVWFDGEKKISAEIINVESLLNNETPLKNNKSLKIIISEEQDKPAVYHIDHHLFLYFDEKNQPDKEATEAFFEKYNLNCENCSNEQNPQVLRLNQKEKNIIKTVNAINFINMKYAGSGIKAYPNRIDLFSPDMFNDFYLRNSWYVINNGQRIFCYEDTYLGDIDLGISQLWENNITGEGVEIGVIDFDGFEFAHPDMSERFLEGWDGVQNAPYNEHSFTHNTSAHGMAVSGIIAANANNNEGSAGIAHQAKIIPLLVDGSEISLLRVLDKAGPDHFNLDILNMSFSYHSSSELVEIAIKNLYANGRVLNGQPLGTVMVSSYGNLATPDSVNLPFPASMSEIISVGASAPDDRLKQVNDSWDLPNFSWGSNYGNYMDVIAPGVCVFTTDFSGNNGYLTGHDYVAFHMTSAAAPVVSAIAALVLQANPNFTATDIKDRILSTADKVHSEDYDYFQNSDKPGHSLEAGFGRVNAFKAVYGETTGLTTSVSHSSGIKILNDLSGYLAIQFSEPQSASKFTAEIIDFSGRVLYKTDFNVTDSDYHELFFNQFSTGIYILRVSDNNFRFVQNEKVFLKN